MAQHGHSEACCSVPPVVSKGYKEKGKFVDINGLKTYTTGPPTAPLALLIIYDIFGFSPQALQGADMLAYAASPSPQYQVYMPDFFAGSPAAHDWYPPQTDEQKQKLGAFFAGPAAPPANAAKVPGIVEAMREYSGTIERVGVLGMCWGGKIVALTTQAGKTPFAAAAVVHPAMVDPNDAKGISVPFCMLASRDEDPEAVKGFEAELKVPKHVETFGDQAHGWMAARADLENEKVRKEYERGYTVVLDWFHKHL